IGSQVGDIARTEGQLRAIEAGKAELAKNGTKEPEAGASQDEWNRYNKSVENTESYKSTAQQYGTGSDLQRAITAATAAISGLASGNINSSVAGAAAPYIANEIGKYITPNSAMAGVMAHAVVNAALARAQGQNALVSATGAAAGEATGILLAQEIYGKRPEALTESERQTISALSTLTAGLAGGLAGNSTGSVVSGAQAGKTTVENNTLGELEGYEEEHEKEIGNRPVKVIPINPLSVGVIDDDGTVQGAGGKVIIINKSKYPESAKHIEDAQAAGQPTVLTIDRAGATQRRQQSLRDTPMVKGMDRDEYPPAMFKEGGAGASVRPVSPSDNRGAGACIGAQCRGLPDGSSVTIKTGGDGKNE
ncbi:VENN motif pre-toxin domain-containing protein, partial [Mangrovibacter phragmitis]|uniref:VENN motif pre-toxin domain-containing protein n=1 Tax=Mangrovibacter phragmitis TaxID=1691903 RepID=UPI000A694898